MIIILNFYYQCTNSKNVIIYTVQDIFLHHIVFKNTVINQIIKFFVIIIFMKMEGYKHRLKRYASINKNIRIINIEINIKDKLNMFKRNKSIKKKLIFLSSMFKRLK